MLDALNAGKLDSGPQIIESSSGNFAIALASLARIIGLEFIPVIDPNISPGKERMLKALTQRQIKVCERDATGGFLLNRIKAVNQFVLEHPGTFNPNQYTNEGNYMSYRDTLAEELITALPRLDYVFICVSSGGTITGVSIRLKQVFPRVKIIAIDVEGSAIFADRPKVRFLSGIGSSIKPPLLKRALIDEIILLPEADVVQGCQLLLRDEGVLAGPSSGATYWAARRVYQEQCQSPAISVLLFPDRGDTYLDTVYNPDWVSEHYSLPVR